MEQDPVNEDAVREETPTELERNYGMLTAGVITLVVLGTTIYLVS
jgi:hypothetical protein